MDESIWMDAIVGSRGIGEGEPMRREIYKGVILTARRSTQFLKWLQIGCNQKIRKVAVFVSY